VRQVGYLLELYRDARSPEYDISTRLPCIYIPEDSNSWDSEFRQRRVLLLQRHLSLQTLADFKVGKWVTKSFNATVATLLLYHLT